MTVFNNHRAGTDLSEPLAAAKSGGEAPIEPAKKARKPGRWKGRISTDDRFFDPLPEEDCPVELWGRVNAWGVSRPR